VFPEALVEPCVKAGCPPGGLVLDPFMGSGTTAVVCRRLGRHYLGFELIPEYVELARRRLAVARETGDSATIRQFPGQEKQS
jgi:DNA modification methylase